jgi:hypothetical protein
MKPPMLEDVNDTEFHDAIMRAWYAFDKYSLTDEAPVYAAALLLHPSRRKHYIDKRSCVMILAVLYRTPYRRTCILA